MDKIAGSSMLHAYMATGQSNLKQQKRSDEALKKVVSRENSSTT